MIVALKEYGFEVQLGDWDLKPVYANTKDDRKVMDHIYDKLSREQNLDDTDVYCKELRGIVKKKDRLILFKDENRKDEEMYKNSQFHINIIKFTKIDKSN